MGFTYFQWNSNAIHRYPIRNSMRFVDPIGILVEFICFHWISIGMDGFSNENVMEFIHRCQEFRRGLKNVSNQIEMHVWWAQSLEESSGALVLDRLRQIVTHLLVELGI